MVRSSGIGFGGFLLGLGLGWYLFRAIDVSLDLVAWLLIIIGVSSILSALIGGRDRHHPVRGLTGGLTGGLILALFLTSGFGFIGELSGLRGIEFGGYRASETRALTGEVTLSSLFLEVDNGNGQISVSTWDRDEYRIDMTVRAKGGTDAEAEENLDRLVVDFTDTVSQGRQNLVLGFTPPQNLWNNYAVSLDISLPADAEIDLDLLTSNGEITLADIEGGTIVVESSNGALTFDEVHAESVTGRTSNGRIQGKLEAETVTLATSNGAIDLTLPCTITSEYILDTSNGGIDLSVSRASTVGYDLDLDTSLGSIDINLPSLSYTRNDRTRKIAKTTGFSEKTVQVTIQAETSIGSIDVN